MAEQEAPSFAIEKIYVKDLSLEAPNTPAVFLEQARPEVSLQLGSGAAKASDDIFEVTLTTTVTAKIGDKTVFLVEVAQAGLFHISNIPEENLGPLLAIACPNILFPYAREVISDTVSRAGFAPIVLQPVNFEAMYAAQQEQQGQQEQTAQA